MTSSHITIPVAKTSLWIAAERYRESKRPDRIINDPFAEVLLGQEGIQMMESMKSTMPQTRTMPLRAKWVEDLICKSVEEGVTQIVNPGCGLDTYAWRMDLPSNVTYFELDFPEIINYKLAKLPLSQALCNYKPIPIDLRDSNWPQTLLENGFDKTKKTLWITMGFLLYLPEDGVHSFLENVNELSSQGSLYTCDLFKKLQSKETDKMEKVLKDNGSPAQFWTDDAPGLFAKHGFVKVLKKLSYYEYSQEMNVIFMEGNLAEMNAQLVNGSTLILVQKQ